MLGDGKMITLPASNLVNRWNTAMNLAWQRAFSADHLDILFLALRAELSRIETASLKLTS